MLAKSESLVGLKKFTEAETLVREVILGSPAEDAEAQAPAYNTLGDCLRTAINPRRPSSPTSTRTCSTAKTRPSTHAPSTRSRRSSARSSRTPRPMNMRFDSSRNIRADSWNRVAAETQ